jgi:hypothetical protein
MGACRMTSREQRTNRFANELSLSCEGTAALRPGNTRISCHAASDLAACAAFPKESRMKLANATKLDRKSGAVPGIYATSWVQCEQRLAAIGISLRHSGQGLVEGAGTTLGLNLFIKVLTGNTTRK